MLASADGLPWSQLGRGRTAALRLAHTRQGKRLRRQLRLFPRQFWLLIGGTLFYITFIAVAFPYTAILLKGRLGVSVAVVGAIMGLTALGGLPLQPLAGSLCDRFGRRAVMITCAAMETLMYGGLAFAHGFWLLCALLFCDRALGWPLFLTASNAMVADLVRPRLRPEGYSLVRLMIGAGEIVGPLAAAALLAAGVALSDLFVAAGLGCLIYLVFTLVALKETKPATQRRAASPGETTEVFGSLVLNLLPKRRARRRDAHRPAGYGQVLRDRRFLAFCAISLLPLFVFGQLYSSFPLLLTSVRHLQPASWGLLLSFSSAVIVVSQYPAVRAAKRLEPDDGRGTGQRAFWPRCWSGGLRASRGGAACAGRWALACPGALWPADLGHRGSAGAGRAARPLHGQLDAHLHRRPGRPGTAAWWSAARSSRTARQLRPADLLGPRRRLPVSAAAREAQGDRAAAGKLRRPQASAGSPA